MMLCSTANFIYYYPVHIFGSCFHCSSRLFVCVEIISEISLLLRIIFNIYQRIYFRVRDGERVGMEASSRSLISELVINNNPMENNSVENL